MRLRIVTIIGLGVLIIGAIVTPWINSDCEFCGGDGKLECPACGGIGAALHFFVVDCACQGDPDCPLCHGMGFYPSMTTKPCELCDGKGWVICSTCSGDGKRNILERIFDLWR